nr:serine carboxypeptidase 24-like [Tanacetum cinerariifolium]
MDVEISTIQIQRFLSVWRELCHYVPQLAQKIHNYNKNHSNPVINLKGFMESTPKNAMMQSLIHILMSLEILMSIVFIHLLVKKDPAIVHQADSRTLFCVDVFQAMIRALKVTRKSILTSMMYNMLCTPPPQGFRISGLLADLKFLSAGMILTLPTYKKLIAAGYRIWIFSGDTDANLPVTATRYSLSHLNLTVKTRWYPWYSNGQVAGHEVPLLQPERALLLFQSFLAGKNLPRS